MRLPIVILCVVFREIKNKYEFLLLKRIPELGGFWQPPGGGMESKDKSELECAFRELFEEAGINKNDIIRIIKNVHYYEINNHYLTGEKIETISEWVYAFQVRPGIKVSLDKNIEPEHEEYRWVSFRQALKLLKWNNNKDALRKAGEILGIIN